ESGVLGCFCSLFAFFLLSHFVLLPQLKRKEHTPKLSPSMWKFSTLAFHSQNSHPLIVTKQLRRSTATGAGRNHRSYYISHITPQIILLRTFRFGNT
ncbi:hypothetical protein CFP56_002217, partial [Quercus suber]